VSIGNHGNGFRDLHIVQNLYCAFLLHATIFNPHTLLDSNYGSTPTVQK
jgi:hypothetical protein